MAPEQTAPHRGKIGPEADVYALGAVLYATLTGRPPFHGATHLETMEMVRREAPVPPRQWNPGIPRDLETIALKALAKEPSRRYPSAADMADDLRRWLDGRPIRARRATLAERAARSCRRNPVVTLLCAALALTLITAFGVVLNALHRERAARAAAEQNFDVAAVVINRLGDLALGTYYGKYPLDEEGLTSTVDLLRRHVATSSSLWERRPRVLQMLSRIDGHRSALLSHNGQFQEGRELARERIVLLQRALEAKPSDIELIGEYAESLIQSAQVEIDAGRPDKARPLYDQSASVLLDHPGIVLENRSFHPFWWLTSLELSDAYLRLPDSPPRNESFDALTRGLTAQLDAAIRAGAIHANRPDVRIFRACLLSDRGDWLGAEELIRGASWSDLAAWIGSPEARHDVAEIGLEAWAIRLVRRWVSDDANRGPLAEAPALEKEADNLSALLGSKTIDGRPSPRASYRICERLAAYSMRQRRAERLDRAEQAARLMRALADRLLRAFPEDPAAHRFLSEALIQESKNAWKRNDLETVRSKYVESIAALRRVLELDPNDARARSMLMDYTKRLAALPAPPKP
jgi:hypothetical protein